MDKEVAKIKVALKVKKKQATSTKDLLSTGSSLTNLACTGRIKGGIAKGDYVLLVGDSQTGKAQPLTAKVLTPTGWKRMGEIKAGDQVIDPDTGFPAKVLKTFPQGMLDVFRVTMSDGSSTECCGDHLWTTSELMEGGRRTAYTTKTTKQIIETICTARQGGPKHRIPMTTPVEFVQNKKLPLDPYLLGALIGNGHFGRDVRIATVETHILETVEASLPSGVGVRKDSKGNYTLSGERGKKNNLIEVLRECGLMGRKSTEKFIPKQYMRSSVENRIRLLQGLMDTDGYASKTANEYSTSSKKLALQIRNLVRSLGGTATLRSKVPYYSYQGEKREGKISYTLSIRLPEQVQPFTLMRKKTRYIERSRKPVVRDIVSVTPIGKRECQCILVNSARNLYITDDFIVTHNTWMGLTILAEAANNPEFDDYALVYDNVENGAKMNIEHFFGKKLAKRIQAPAADENNPQYSETVEEFYFNLDDWLSKGPVVYILDSMDALEALDDVEHFQKEKKAHRNNKEPGGSYGMSKSKKNSTNMRLVVRKLRETGSILVVIAQTRDKVGGFIPGQKTRGGGRSLKFYAHLELWLSVKGDITKKIGDKTRQQGNKTKVKVEKSRHTGRQRTVDIPIYHSHGIDDVGGCIDWLLEEKHWNKKSGKINAKELDLCQTREKLIQEIEGNNREEELRSVVVSVWNQIEDDLKITRKKRYE